MHRRGCNNKQFKFLQKYWQKKIDCLSVMYALKEMS